MKNKSILINIVVVVLVIGSLITYKIISPKTSEHIYDEASYSVVEIYSTTEDGGYESNGTAVMVCNDGYFITNAHVVTYETSDVEMQFDEIKVRFTFEQEYRDIELISYDLIKDLAILKLDTIPSEAKMLKIGAIDDLDYGTKVYAVGNSQNQGISISSGIIGNPLIEIEYDGITKRVIQSDITINSGNSGGALINENGKLVGITSFRTRDNLGYINYGICYSIPINDIMSYYESIILN